MLRELRVRDLGVIGELTLELGPGMTAITGETGAGKTLVVEAIELLVGERADPSMVRAGSAEARVEGRFEVGDAEVVVVRVVPAGGRSRAYVNGSLATAGELSELGRGLVDLHGQHAHQSLLSPSVQRAALDRAGDIDLGPLEAARREAARLEGAITSLGGDARLRAREIDLLRYQASELAAASLDDPAEDVTLAREEDDLAGATGYREAGTAAYRALVDDGGGVDRLGEALAALGGRVPFADAQARLAALAAEASELASDLRRQVESIDVDPERLDRVRARRKLLGELRRRYGDSLEDVIAFRDLAEVRLVELEHHDERVGELERARAEAMERAAEAAARVAAARRATAPGLGRAVEEHLHALALPRARFAVEVAGDPPGDDVTFALGANPGEPVRPLARVASGGELARTMLAVRLVLTAGPPCLVFDEVDAGIGGEAALAVGRALSALTRPRPSAGGLRHQVLVVTHLPQVAAFADCQVAVTKLDVQGRTVATATVVEGAARVVELSRMLSGQPASAAARDHAEELLAAAVAERGA